MGRRRCGHAPGGGRGGTGARGPGAPRPRHGCCHRERRGGQLDPGTLPAARRQVETATALWTKGTHRGIPPTKRVDLSSPFVDAVLPDGSRLHVVTRHRVTLARSSPGPAIGQAAE